MRDDSNKAKDLYVSATVRPIKNLSIKGTYNYGQYTSQKLDGGTGVGDGLDLQYQPMNRAVVGAWYNDPNGLDLRAEYGLMNSSRKIEGKQTDLVKESGAYVFAGWHLGKFLPMLRWDMYNDDVNKASANNYNRILVGCNFQIFKNLRVQVNYGHFMYSDEFKAANNYDSSDQVQVMAMFKF